VLCRHTIAHWRRFVKSPEGAALFAACELLVEEGVQVEDWRTIACTYWGKQPECPFFEAMGEGEAPKGTRQPLEAGLPAKAVPGDLERAARRLTQGVRVRLKGLIGRFFPKGGRQVRYVFTHPTCGGTVEAGYLPEWGHPKFLCRRCGVAFDEALVRLGWKDEEAG